CRPATSWRSSTSESEAA
ncbi:hypothetical protein CFC21_090309, partial [Triticum aestivum]